MNGGGRGVLFGTYAQAGNARVGTWPGNSTYAAFAHQDNFPNTGDYAIIQNASGTTIVNCKGGQFLSLRQGNAEQWGMSGLALYPGTDAAEELGTASARVLAGHFFESVRIGTNPATAGAVRLANNTSVEGRNAANSANLNLIKSDGSNVVEVGATGAAGLTLNGGSTGPLWLNGSVTLQANTPAAFGTSQNDYALAGGATVYRLAASAGSLSITGIVPPNNGAYIIICNVGANAFTLANQSGSSSANNRIITGTGANLSLGVDQSVALYYDATTLRWRVLKNA